MFELDYDSMLVAYYVKYWDKHSLTFLKWLTSYEAGLQSIILILEEIYNAINIHNIHIHKYLLMYFSACV